MVLTSMLLVEGSATARRSASRLWARPTCLHLSVKLAGLISGLREDRWPRPPPSSAPAFSQPQPQWRRIECQPDDVEQAVSRCQSTLLPAHVTPVRESRCCGGKRTRHRDREGAVRLAIDGPGAGRDA